MSISSITSAVLGKSIFSAKNELTGAACWTSISIKDVEVNESSLNTGQPVSSEQVSNSETYTSLLAADINTLKIIQPSNMRITAFCSDLSTLESVISLFANTQATLSITTKGITAPSLMVVSVDIEQTAAMMSATKVVIELEQSAPPASTSAFNPLQGTDASAANTSVQTLPGTTITPASLYNSVSHFL